MHHRLCAALCLVLLQCIGQAAAQLYADWLWGFKSQTLAGDEFEECQSVPLTIVAPPSNASALGVPPYYFMAFEVGGTPTTMMVGSDPSNLVWAVNHKRGAKLMLTMMDSQQRIGGIPPTLYTVTAGANASCIPPAPQNAASVHPNVTDTLNTCDPWGISIQGGQKPYTVVVSGLGLPTIQNKTLAADDDTFTWVDRIKPGVEIMASVVDANGQWGVSSQLVRTTGSTNTDCSAPGVSATQEAKGMHTQVVVGLVVGLSVPAVVTIAALVWYFRRRARIRQRGVWDKPDILSSALGSPPSDFAKANVREVLPIAGNARHPKGPIPTDKPVYEVTPLSAVYFDREFGQGSSASGSNNGTGSTFYGNPYSVPAGGSAADLTTTYESRFDHTHPPSLLSTSRIDSDGAREILIQHRDAGVVQELPPPYADGARYGSSPARPEKEALGLGPGPSRRPRSPQSESAILDAS